MKYNVIYLTGAPATGKTSLCSALQNSLSPLAVFEYGQELSKYVSNKNGRSIDQQTIREYSSGIITPEDVTAVDSLLIDFVSRNRLVSDVIIDTHAVTKESYGFRVTPFTLTNLTSLAPSYIVTLYVDSDTNLKRIEGDSRGRPLINNFEANFHNVLQGSVSVVYSINTGCPLYFLEATQPLNFLVDWFAQILGRQLRR